MAFFILYDILLLMEVPKKGFGAEQGLFKRGIGSMFAFMEHGAFNPTGFRFFSFFPLDCFLVSFHILFVLSFLRWYGIEEAWYDDVGAVCVPLF